MRQRHHRLRTQNAVRAMIIFVAPVAQATRSHSAAWPVTLAIRSKSLSQCSTVSPASSAVAAMPVFRHAFGTDAAGAASCPAGRERRSRGPPGRRRASGRRSPCPRAGHAGGNVAHITRIRGRGGGPRTAPAVPLGESRVWRCRPQRLIVNTGSPTDSFRRSAASEGFQAQSSRLGAGPVLQDCSRPSRTEPDAPLDDITGSGL